METLLKQLTDTFAFSGDIRDDILNFLRYHGLPKTALHAADVAAEAHQLAVRFKVEADKAELAGRLHDISAVFPAARRAAVARQLGVPVLPEEDTFPMIIHQKLSVVLAREIFGVTDTAVLSAVGCHTTLKRDASQLDKVVFVADKIAWDQPGVPPYRDDIMAALNQSIDHAAFVYLEYLWQMRDKLKVLHPWTQAAYWQHKQSLDD